MLTIERLTANGYVHIGMDHFALADDELAVAQRHKTLQRNFQGYSTRGDAALHAFGISAISQADGAYWQNTKELAEYYSVLESGKLPIVKGYVLTEEDRLRREAISRLMCHLSLDFDSFGIDFRQHFAAELASLDDLEADGLIIRDANGLTVTDAGRLFLRNIAVRFDAYFTGAGRRFSQSV